MKYLPSNISRVYSGTEFDFFFFAIKYETIGWYSKNINLKWKFNSLYNKGLNTKNQLKSTNLFREK